MRLRLTLSSALIKVGRFVQSLSIMVLKPNDLVEFSRQTYSKEESIKGWSEDKFVQLGLFPNEVSLLDKLPVKKGKLLLLGVGGGREVVPLAEKGFEITGVDFIPELVEKARAYAAKNGFEISGYVQDISKLYLESSSYNVVWLSYGMYSCVPTRKKRILMLSQINKALKPGGCCVCQFFWNPSKKVSPFSSFLRKAVAILTLGNLTFEKGDELFNNIEFSHSFQTEEEILSEFNTAGFEEYSLEISGSRRAGAILQKPQSL